MTSLTTTAEQVRALTALGLAELREVWRGRYGEPPRMRSAELLRRVLAWRIQSDADGGIDAATAKLLQNDTSPVLFDACAPGARLAREWHGRRHEVIILDIGVEYEGQTFGSLSEVARTITGQRWNGPRFFGLRQANVR